MHGSRAVSPTHLSFELSKRKIKKTLILVAALPPGFGGRVFVGAGEYFENLSITHDVKVQATESAKGKVLVSFNTTRSDVPVLDIKVRVHACKRICCSDIVLSSRLFMYNR